MRLEVTVFSDSHIYNGYTVPPNYDSMIGKVITHGRDETPLFLECAML